MTGLTEALAGATPGAGGGAAATADVSAPHEAQNF
jgi:hypothetical protein